MSQPHGPSGSGEVEPSAVERVLPLIERIHRAARSPGGWTDAARALGEAFGGAAVAISLSVPDDSDTRTLYSFGLDPAYAESHPSAAFGAFSWDLPAAVPLLAGRFARLDELFPTVDLAGNPYAREWMAPQGLPPLWPMVHFVATEGLLPLAAVAIFRRGSSDPFGAEDVAFANLLVPHLRRAYRLFVALGGARQHRLALAEVMDRLSTGIFLIDAKRRVTVANRSARRMVAGRDGLLLEGQVLQAVHRVENRILGELLARVVTGTVPAGAASGLLALSRPSGRRPLTLYTVPLLEGPSPEEEGAAVAAVFVADPEGGGIETSEALRRMFGLTEAEAALVSHLVEGRRLEEAARLRGVSRNTAKSQLRRVFAKTGTRRQAELVRLVLTGMPGGRDP